MDPRTRRRVPLDTNSRLGRFVALAVVLHAPLTPLAGFLGLIRLLGAETEAPALPPVTEIPLDIIDDESGSDGKPAEAPEAKAPEPAGEGEAALPKEPDPVTVKPKKPKKPKEPELPDAGAPADAGAPDASKTDDAGVAPDAADAGAPHKPGEGIGSPVAGIGDKRVVDPNANVQLVVYNDRVREHPLGARIGPLLRGIYQWRDFFGPTSIDPIRDVDRMLIIGPQLRDSRDVIAILQFNVPQERIRAAVDVLVQRDPEGSWSTSGVPVARAHADRGERVFVFPSPQILVVTPPTAAEAASHLPRKFRLPAPKGDEIALAKLSTPWRAFLGLPVVIPKSITSADLRLSPRPDGGVVIDVLAHDETDPLATSDAQALTAALDIGLMAGLVFGVQRIQGGFEADGKDIRGEIVLPRVQVETLLGIAAGYLGGSVRPRPAPSPTAVPVTPAPFVPSPTPTPAASP